MKIHSSTSKIVCVCVCVSKSSLLNEIFRKKRDQIIFLTIWKELEVNRYKYISKLLMLEMKEVLESSLGENVPDF